MSQFIDIRKLALKLRIGPNRMTRIQNHTALNGVAFSVSALLFGFYISKFSSPGTTGADAGVIGGIISFVFIAFLGFITALTFKSAPLTASDIDDQHSGWLNKWNSLFIICLIAALFLILLVSFSVAVTSNATLVGLVTDLTRNWSIEAELLTSVIFGTAGTCMVALGLRLSNRIVDSFWPSIRVLAICAAVTSIVLYVVAFFLP